MSSASHSAGLVAGWPQKRELGPLSSGQGRLMPFVNPGRIEQSDRVQAASFAPQQHHEQQHQPQQHQSQWQTTVLLKLMNGFQHSLLSLHLYID